MKLIALFFLISSVLIGQNIHGTILDAETKEPLENVNIFIEKYNAGTGSNAQGKFTVFLKSGVRKTDTLQFSLLGYVTIRTTILYLKENKNITEYRRELNLNKALSTVSYKSNGNLITEKIFVSNPDKAIIVEITSEAKEGLNGTITLSRPKDNEVPTVKVTSEGNNLLVMRGEVTQREGEFNSESFPILNGVKFETCLKIDNLGGKINRNADNLELVNVKKATFYIVSNSSYYFENYSQQNKIDLAAIDSKSFESLQRNHIKDHQNFYNRVLIDLGDKSLDTINNL